MKKTKLTARLLSLTLIISMLLPSLTGLAGAVEPKSMPASITASFTAEGDWTPTETPTDRVRLDISSNDVVVDEFRYTVTSDKDATSAEGAKAADRYAVGDYGYLTLKAGKDAIPGEVLTVTADVKYYDGDDIIFADNVVPDKDGNVVKKFVTSGSSSDVSKNYDYTISDTSMVADGATDLPAQVARTGEFGITTKNNSNGGAPSADIAGKKGTLTAWYYDPVEDGKTLLGGSSYDDGTNSDAQFGMHINATANISSPNRHYMGIAALSGHSACNTNYYYRATIGSKTSGTNAHGTWTVMPSNVPNRSEGWHKMQWIVDDSGLTMEWDGHEVYTDSTVTALNKIFISNNKGYRPTTQSLLENRHFLDDISVIGPEPTLKSGSTTVSITVAGGGDGPNPSETIGLVYGKTASDTVLGKDGGRVYLEGINDLAIESAVYSVSGGNAGKVEINPLTGELTVKSGAVIGANEKVTVNAEVTYYSNPDEVYFKDNFVDNSKKQLDNTPNYQYASGQSLFGKTALTGASGGADGGANYTFTDALTPDATTTYTFSGWIYSPTPLQGDTAATSSEKLALGVFSAASGTSLGIIQSKGTSNTSPSADGFAGEFTVRGTVDSGKWYRTNLSRTMGWHKFVFEVTPNGTKAAIYLNGTEKHEITSFSGPSAIDPGTTSIKSIRVWTNWARSTQTGYNNIIDRLFVDGLSVVKTGAATAKTTATVEVSLAAQGAPVITTQPTGLTKAVGESASFTVSATDPTGSSLSYKWYRCDTQEATGTAVSGATGATGATLTLDNLIEGVTYYYCNVTNSAGTTKSAVVKLTVLAGDSRPVAPGAPAVNESGDATFAYGGGASFTIRINIYRDTTLVKTADKPVALDNSNWGTVNILSELRSLGIGTYTVTATRLGSNGGLDSLESDKGTVTLKAIDAPAAPAWTGYSLSWDAIPGAKSYRVQLYKDGVASGSPITVDAPTTSALMTLGAAGSYTGTVTVIADTSTLLFDSAASPQSSAKGEDRLNLTFVPASLHKGDTGRVTLESPNTYGILDFTYKSSNPAVSIDKNGTISVADDLPVPTEGLDVTISADVEYYLTTVWANNMESYGRFDYNELTSNSTTSTGARLNLTDASALPDGLAARTGRMGATPYAKNGYGSNVALKTPTTGSIFFWYYDPYTETERTSSGTAKHGVAINVHGADDPAASNFVGVGYGDGPSGSYATPNFYTYRTSGTDWKNLAVPRSTGWHKFEFRVTGAGMELYIDDVKARNLDPSITQITGLQLCNNWGSQSDAGAYINGKHFVDDIFVVAEKAPTEKTTLTTTVKILPKNYTITPSNSNYDLNYPEDITFTVNPDLADLASVTLGSTVLSAEQYIVDSASGTLTVKSAALSALSKGVHTLALTMTDTQTVSCTLNVIETVSRAYYVDSLNGNNDNDGLTPATAWRTLGKLNAAAPFSFGDRIYLEANSIWDGQLVLSGSGRPNKEIILTRYTVEDGDIKYGADCATQSRPTINGNGTVGTKPIYIVEKGHDGRYKYSAAVELWNAGHWEISWLEVTNLGETSMDGNGRCGIMVMNEYTYYGDPSSNSSSDAKSRQSFLDSRKDHIYITDSYVHDVNGLFQDVKDVNGVNGTKHAGGIIGFGYLSDFRVERCRVSRVDIEGIRNTPFHPAGTTGAAGYPKDIATNIIFRNNFVDKLHGDAIVIAGGNDALMEYNVATRLGRSYVSTADGSNYVPGTDPVNLGTGKNFAAIWFMGCGNSLAQYNECYDTQYYTPNDGEAWDVDMQSNNCTYQYNYSHHNAGGCILWMGSQINSIFRYNLSIEDGGTDKNPHTLFMVTSGASNGPNPRNYPQIYNNIFTIAKNVTTFIDGSDRDTLYLHFQNNIVLADSHISNRPALYMGSHPNESKGKGNITGGEFTNNIIWPADLYTKFEEKLKNGITVSGNQIVDPKLINTGGSTEMVLSKAWTSAVNGSDGTEGIILSGENWFDAKVNEILGGFKLNADSPAINKGAKVPYWEGIPVEDRFPITRDFFGNPIDETDPDWVPDIGIHEFSNQVDGEGKFTVTFDKNGGTGEAAPTTKTVTPGQTLGDLPAAPTGADTFVGWNTKADRSGTEVTADTLIKRNMTVYAQWAYAYTVTFKVSEDAETAHATKTVISPATTLADMPSAPTAEGKVFAGWYSKVENTEVPFTSSTELTGDLTVYAKWVDTESYYVVTFSLNNGADSDAYAVVPVPKSENATVGDLMPQNPTWEGHTFLGWSTDAQNFTTEFTAATPITGNIEVYAHWTGVSYAVTFKLNDGTDTVHATKTVTPPVTTTALPAAPTRAGYTFTGWNTGADGKGEAFTKSTKVTANVTVYAQWSYSFTVTFDKNGGGVDADPATMTVTNPKTTVDALPEPPTRENYAFKGWNTEADDSGVVFTDKTPVTGNITVYAQWVKVYVVTFDLNDAPETVSEPATLEELEPPVEENTLPVETGETAIPSDEADEAEAIEEEQIPADAAPTPVTLNEAAPEVETGSEPITVTVVWPATKAVLPANPVREGYLFKGWNTAADGSGTPFTAQTPVSGHLTVYAQWEAEENEAIYVTFDRNGGLTDADPLTVKVADGHVTLPANPSWDSEHTFQNWNTKADGTGDTFTAETVVTKSITVYAKWEHNYSYTVTFHKNGGDTETAPVKVESPATTAVLPTNPTRAGYVFKSWNTKANGSGDAFTAQTTVSGDLTVYAQWAKAYTVTFRLNDGIGGDAYAIVEVAYPDTTATLPGSPSRSGYTFSGWNTAADGSGSAFTGSTEVTEDLTVYAQWQVYTPSPSNPTPTPKPVEKPAENVNASEGGQVTVKENKDGSSTYTFKPEKDKEVLYVRVNGLLVKADSYTAPKGEDPSIVVVFGKSGVDHAKDYADTAELPEYMTEAVNYVVGSGLFQGNGESFVPMGNMNRAMFATVLARLYGADTAKMTSDFADVAQDSWYNGSVAWISDMGITSGVGGGRFAPESDMTRQELVTLVYRFAQKVGADVSASGDLADFPDGDSVDAWSTDAMSWAVGLGMLNGKSGSLAPNDTITRVEAAIILQRMADLLTKA